MDDARMSVYDIYSKRRQTKRYLRDPVSAELIDELIRKTLKIVPSKQNLIPYTIHVLGPEDVESRDAFWALSQNNYVPERTHTHQVTIHAPYLLIFTSRLAEPNEFIKGKIPLGRSFGACDPERYDGFSQQIEQAIEVGMFSTILTGLCIEKGLGVSYFRVFPDWGAENKEDRVELWKDLPFITDPPLFSMQIGYPHELNIFYEGETRPEVEKVVNWVE